MAMSGISDVDPGSTAWTISLRQGNSGARKSQICRRKSLYYNNLKHGPAQYRRAVFAIGTGCSEVDADRDPAAYWW
jgi:hypothetical protein